MRSQKLDSVYTCGHKISRKQFLHMRSQKLAQTVSTHAVTDVHGSVMLRCRARSVHWVTVNRQDKRQRVKADSTLRSSQAVPHPSTDRALCRLTSEVRRDPVHSTRYGRQRRWYTCKTQRPLAFHSPNSDAHCCPLQGCNQEAKRKS